jgi:hypothetical protein
MVALAGQRCLWKEVEVEVSKNNDGLHGRGKVFGSERGSEEVEHHRPQAL